jgi:two-component system cell cycle response regulator DivK
MSRILIVEDNERNLKVVREALQGNGFTTLEAMNATDGLALAAEQLPDLILMDIQLPGMSGIEALRLLRADARTSGIPVIAVTASVMDKEMGLIKAAGFDACVAKPIRYASFLAAVRSMLERART